jgi:hypothetical protein
MAYGTAAHVSGQGIEAAAPEDENIKGVGDQEDDEFDDDETDEVDEDEEDEDGR